MRRINATAIAVLLLLARLHAAEPQIQRSDFLAICGDSITEQRLYSLDAWKESPYYSDRERAALAWTEAVTRVSETHVPDEVYKEARDHFSEKELADLTVAVATINAWNRLLIAARTTPGTYQPVKREIKKAA